MNSKSTLLVLLVAATTLMLSACSLPPSFKYKLTLSVETPDGIKTGFNVVEIHHGQVMITASGGIMTHARGEALYLDLGPGRRPLLALLTKTYDAKRAKKAWGEVSPFNILARIYGENFTHYGSDGENLRAIVKYRGAKEITPEDLPDLVTFVDVNDPKSVMAVDPFDLQSTLGEGVVWHSLTLEITDEPLTSGIEQKLVWLDEYYSKLLDGHRPGEQGDGSLASRMNTGSFRKGTR